MRIIAITLFPEQLQAFFAGGVVGSSVADGRVSLDCINPRDFSQNRHRRIDDRPFGGGPGMVMQYEPLAAAIGAAREQLSEAHVVGLSPQGERFQQQHAVALQQQGDVILVCGRYEGYDERLVERHLDAEYSLGDFVISGGEIAAAAIVDAVCRLEPGVLGHAESACNDSFSEGLLDWPHYTRPEIADGMQVPPVLLGGDHAAIAKWRRREALGRTAERRPDLLAGRTLSEEDQQLLEEYWAARGDARKT